MESDGVVYGILRLIVRLLYSLAFRIEVRGNIYLPEGGALVVANHLSAWDPPLVGVVFPRRLRFMAKAELFRIPVLGAVLRWLGAFPVTRERADREALRTALRLLEAGWAVVIFPEGTRYVRDADGRPGPARRGAVFLAQAADVPVIPVAIRGRYGFRRRIVVNVGQPVRLPSQDGRASRERLRELADGEIMGRIRALWEDAS